MADSQRQASFCAVKAESISLSEEQLRAARVIHNIYAAAERAGFESSLEWIENLHSGQANRILEDAFPVTMWGHRWTIDKVRSAYTNSTRALMPIVHQVSVQWARQVLLRQEEEVLDPLRKLVNEQEAKERLHIAARTAQERARNVFEQKEMTKEEFMEVTGQAARSSGGTVPSRLKRVSYVKAVQEGGDQDLRKLMAHPLGTRIVDSFASSPHEGQAYATAIITESAEATRWVCAQLSEDETLIWRFPPAVAAGVVALKLQLLPGVSAFSLSWAKLEGRTWVEKGIDKAGNAIFALELVGGPLGAAVAEVLDIVLALIGTAVAFVRDLEQDQAGVAAAFADEAEKLSEGSNYSDTALEAVAAFTTIFTPGRVSTLKNVAQRRTQRKLITARVDPPGQLPDELDAKGVNARGISARELKRPKSGKPELHERGTRQPGSIIEPNAIMLPGQPAKQAPNTQPSVVAQSPIPPPKKSTVLTSADVHMTSTAAQVPANNSVQTTAATTTPSEPPVEKHPTGGEKVATNSKFSQEAASAKAADETGTANKTTTDKGTNNTSTGAPPLPPQPPQRVPGTLGVAPRVAPGTDPRTANGGIEYIEAMVNPLGERRVVIAGIIQSPGLTTTNSLFRGNWQPNKHALLKGYDKSHLFPSQWGDECYEGIMWAPEELNRSLQKRLENVLAALDKKSPKTPLKVRVTAIAYPKGFTVEIFEGLDVKGNEIYRTEVIDSEHVLKELRYEFETPDGLFTVEINVDKPPSGSFQIAAGFR